MIGAVGLGIGDRRNLFEGAEAPTLADVVDGDLARGVLLEVRARSALLQYMPERHDLTVHAHVHEPLFRLERLEPADGPCPDRSFVRGPAGSILGAEVLLQEDQSLRLTREQLRPLEVGNVAAQPFDAPRGVLHRLFAGDLEVHDAQREG